MVGLMRTSRAFQLSFLLVIAALPCHSGEITGTIKPFAKSVRVMLWYLDSENHCACDSCMEEKNVDGSGRFTFKDLRKGRYAIFITPVGLRCLPKTVKKVVVGDKTTDIGTVKLQPSAWVTGRVSPPGRNLGVSPSPNPGTSCKTKPDGSFEVDGLTAGKHKLSVFQDGYMVRFAEVQIDGVREYKLAPITLVSISSVTGRLEGKLLYAGSPASQADLDTGRVQLHVTALRADADPRSPGPRYGYFAVGHDIAPASGDYRIAHLPPGRYDLLACGPGCLVRGVSDLPTDAASSPEDTKAVLEAIKALGTAFDAGDEQSVRNHATAQCVFVPCVFLQMGRNDDCTALLKAWSESADTPGERRIVLIRVGRERAVVFSRAQAISKKDNWGRAYEIIESWRLVRDAAGWKLARYSVESEMMDMLSALRISSPGHPKAPCTVDQLAPVSIVITDDPRLAGVSAEAGKVTSGHDLDLTVQ